MSKMDPGNPDDRQPIYRYNTRLSQRHVSQLDEL